MSDPPTRTTEDRNRVTGLRDGFRQEGGAWQANRFTLLLSSNKMHRTRFHRRRHGTADAQCQIV